MCIRDRDNYASFIQAEPCEITEAYVQKEPEYVYKHIEYKNKKNCFKRLITFDWKKKDVYKYKIRNTNDILKEDSIRIIEAI